MIQALIDQIEYHNKQYWVNKAPVISDEAYDLLVEDLRKIDPDHPLVNYIPPIYEGAKIKHLRPMLSLAKAYAQDEVLTWATSVARRPNEMFKIVPKWDGCSLENQGRGVVTTRGDGEYGEDASHIARFLPPDFTYGEAVISKSDFARLKPCRRNGEPYKNTRAAVAGILADAKADGSILTFRPFGESAAIRMVTLEELRAEDWGLLLNTLKVEINLPIDGLVISLVDQVYAESLGATGHHPRHSIALKCKNPAGTTELLGVEFQNGKFRISIVALVAPCEISGTLTQRATLHNLDFIKSHGLRIGDTIKLAKKGDVIPGVEQVLEHNGGEEIVCTACPACGKPPVIIDQNYVCPNPLCEGTITQRLLDSLNRMGVMSIGPAVALDLVRAGYCSVPDVFGMSEADWRKIPGFALRSAQTMRNQLVFILSSHVEDFRILAAMNIEGVGLTLAKKICQQMHISELSSGSGTIQTITDVGPTLAPRIIRDFDHSLWAWALTHVTILWTFGAVAQPTVCFTGADTMSRDDWAKWAARKGYAYASAVTKKLSVLVASRTDSTKAKKAAQYGIRVVTYDDFRKELESK